MNSQFQPHSGETLNKQAHDRLLHEASLARLSKRSLGRRASRKADRSPAFDTGSPRPSLLEPALSAILTAAVAMQVAFLVAI